MVVRGGGVGKGLGVGVKVRRAEEPLVARICYYYLHIPLRRKRTEMEKEGGPDYKGKYEKEAGRRRT